MPKEADARRILRDSFIAIFPILIHFPSRVAANRPRFSLCEIAFRAWPEAIRTAVPMLFESRPACRLRVASFVTARDVAVRSIVVIAVL
jgi:hypothetical protein